VAKAKKNKSAKTGKLPKTVAGIELPMELRKQGAKLLDLIKNPMVGDLVAAGLVALAANVRNQGKTGNDSTKDKQSAADGFSKTAANLATVVATRAAEKITSKLGERPAPAAAASAPAAATAPKPAARKPAARKPAAKPKAPAKAAAAKPAATKTAAAKRATTKASTAKPAAAKAPAKPATAKPKAPAARKPAAKTAARKPAARKPATKPAS
jgi:hypothetical protein